VVGVNVRLRRRVAARRVSTTHIGAMITGGTGRRRVRDQDAVDQGARGQRELPGHPGRHPRWSVGGRLR
jgi:hypothetical protein